MARILSLDDDTAMLELMGLILQRAGYQYICTSNSFEALNILRTEPVDVFTQDIMRPDIDGWDFYRLLKDDPLLCDVPVLIITCQAHSVDKMARLHLAPVEGYLTKPFGPMELLAAIEEILLARSKSPPTEQDRLRVRLRLEEAARLRTELLTEVFATLPNVTLKGQLVEIEGYYGRYQVSLTTGQVIRLPRQRLCIVPDRSISSCPTLCLPFENTDATTERIISTVLMLAADYAIEDKAILQQLKEQPNESPGRNQDSGWIVGRARAPDSGMSSSGYIDGA